MALRARGFEVLLAPMLRFEPVKFSDDEDAAYGAGAMTRKIMDKVQGRR